MSTVFYSWQSDLLNRCNRGLIEKALETAVKAIKQHPDVEAAVREHLAVDKDTKGIPGSPNIADTIIGKITSADACVFDVSIVARSGERAFPNPNVLIELGYAMREHREEKVILVANLAFGRIEELPFDLRHKRVVTYSASEGTEALADERKTLANQLRLALELVYIHLEENRFTSEETEFYLLLHNNVRSFLDAVEENRHRRISPWIDTFKIDCRHTADNLRELTADDVAEDHTDLSAQIQRVATGLGELADWQMTLGGGAPFYQRVQQVAEEAKTLVSPCLPALRIKYARNDHKREKRRAARRAVAEFERFARGLENSDMRTLNDVRSVFEQIGAGLLRLSRELEAVADVDEQLIRKAGHALHVSNIRETKETGFQPEKGLHNRLAPVIEDLRGLASVPTTG
ncbi:MAG: hypothetical protein H6807_15195 [Planctomycetes bacterium]|nr:hypothetical protein [Planctomycetota bacterium]